MHTKGAKPLLFVVLTLCLCFLLDERIYGQTSLMSRAKRVSSRGSISREYFEGLVSLRVKERTTAAQINSFLQQFSAKVARGFDRHPWGTIEIPNQQSIDAVVDSLEKRDFVLYAEPAYVLHADVNDPYFTNGRQWSFDNYGQNPPGGISGADIKVTAAWGITSGKASITVGILDSGLPIVNPGYLSHPDLCDAPRIEIGLDFVQEQRDQFPSGRDFMGHGTHVAGIIGAQGNNSVGVAGIAYGCKLLMEKVFNIQGITYPEVILDATADAVEYGVKVINFSGGWDHAVGQDLFLEDAVRLAYDNNIVFVTIAGNSGTAPEGTSNVTWPGMYASTGTYEGFTNGYPNVITVGATNPWDDKSEFSSTGREVSIGAPGGTGRPWTDQNDVFSTLPNYSPYFFEMTAYKPFGTPYGYLSGTSMAAPHVTGLVGLISSLNQNLTPSSIVGIIEESADKVDNENHEYIDGRNDYLGYGRINAYNALKYTIEHYATTIGGAGVTVSFPDDITIASGTTLTVLPGTTVKFASGKRLTVNGALTVQGTSESPIIFDSIVPNPVAGSWYGIVLNGGPNTLSYCTIEHATDGVEVKNTSTNLIDHCTVQYCSNSAILGYNTAKTYGALTIQNSQLLSSYRGLGLSNARADLINCTLDQNSGHGLYGANSSLCYATGTSFSANGNYGVLYSGATSTLTLGGRNYEAGYDEVASNNTNGVASAKECSFSSGALGNLGDEDAGLVFWGYNNIFHSQNHPQDMKLITNSGTTLTHAEMIFWGSEYADGPPPGEFEGPVDYTMFLTEPGFLLREESQFTQQATAVQSLQTAVPIDIDTGRLLSERLLGIISRDSDSALAALHMLSLIAGPGGERPVVLPAGWASYLESVIGGSTNRRLRECALAYRADALTSDGPSLDTEAARLLTLAETGSDLWRYAQEKKFQAALAGGNLASAASILTTLKESACLSKDDVDFLTELLTRNTGDASVPLSRTVAHEASEPPGKKLPLPDQYSLVQNYPNPFNPQTTIRFALPSAGKILLKVYDVLGREVTLLADGYAEAGYHEAVWNAVSMASGVYYARFTVTDDLGKVAFMKVVRLLLIK